MNAHTERLTPGLQARRQDLGEPYELYGALPELAHHPDPFTRLSLSPLVIVSRSEAEQRAANLKRGRPLDVFEVTDHQGRHRAFVKPIDRAAEPLLAEAAVTAYVSLRDRRPEPLGGAGFWNIGVLYLRVPEHLAERLNLDAPVGHDLEGTFFRVRPYGSEEGGQPCWRPAGVGVRTTEIRWYPEIENLRAAD